MTRKAFLSLLVSVTFLVAGASPLRADEGKEPPRAVAAPGAPENEQLRSVRIVYRDDEATFDGRPVNFGDIRTGLLAVQDKGRTVVDYLSFGSSARSGAVAWNKVKGWAWEAGFVGFQTTFRSGSVEYEAPLTLGKTLPLSLECANTSAGTVLRLHSLLLSEDATGFRVVVEGNGRLSPKCGIGLVVHVKDAGDTVAETVRHVGTRLGAPDSLSPDYEPFRWEWSSFRNLSKEGKREGKAYTVEIQADIVVGPYGHFEELADHVEDKQADSVDERDGKTVLNGHASVVYGIGSDRWRMSADSISLRKMAPDEVGGPAPTRTKTMVMGEKSVTIEWAGPAPKAATKTPGP